MEYEKRYLTELYRPVAIANGATALRLQPTGQQMLRMSNQVKEVLPNVPLDAIRRDLGKIQILALIQFLIYYRICYMFSCIIVCKCIIYLWSLDLQQEHGMLT